jgi:anti-anti-sigma factor
MAEANGVFEVEVSGETLIITPQKDLSELAYESIETSGKTILDRFVKEQLKNVIVDLHKTDYYGSSALGFFLKLWKRVRQQNGHMALCNISEHEKEILRVMKLHHLWPICSSRQDALRRMTI